MNTPTLSYEFFPPRNEAQSRRFWRTIGALELLDPAYISLTWGALGTDSQASLETLALLQRDTSLDVAAHLTCIGQNAEQLRETLDLIESFGVRRIVALRGDNRQDAMLDGKAFTHASQLVLLIARERPHLDISVAAYPEAHPEAISPTDDICWLEHKLAAGASRAITQFFFEPDTFLRWRDEAVRMGVDKPLVPGILPIHDIERVQKFASSCGAKVPQNLIARFSGVEGTSDRQELAIEHSVELCRALEREGVDEFHLYTLNQSAFVRGIASELQGHADANASAVAA